MDETEVAGIVVQTRNVPSVHSQKYVSKQVSAVQSTSEGQCYAQARDFKHSMKPTMSTKHAVREMTDHVACSARAKVHPYVTFGMLKQSRTKNRGHI